MNRPEGRNERIDGYMRQIETLARQVGDGVAERETAMDVMLGPEWQPLAHAAMDLATRLEHDSEVVNDLQAQELRRVLSDALDALDHRHR